MALSAEQPGPAVVYSLLAESGIQATTVIAVGEGRTSVTYVVDDRWIVQFPRFDSAVEAARVQVRLMPLVQACVSFAVPVPSVLGEHENHPVLWYRQVPGRALRPDDQWRELAPLLRELHRVPTEQASTVLDVAGTAAEWYRGYAQFRAQLDQSLTSFLPDELQQRVAAEYDWFLGEAGEFTPVVLHSDLAAEHIMIDPETSRPTGLIDFD